MRKVLIVLTITTIFLACIQLSAEQIVEKMKEKYNSTKDMKGVMIVTTNLGKQQTQTTKFAMKKPNKWKTEDENILTISNGKTMWIYDKQKNEVAKFNLPEVKQPEFDYGKIVKDMLEKYDIELVGEDKISNRNCYVIELKPKGKDYFINQKLWVDKEYWYPLKIEINYGNFSSTVEYKNVEFNAGISDEEFEFKPPEGAKIVEKELKLPEKLTIEEAQKRVNFTILKPRYTAGFTFDYAMVFEGFVQLYYEKGDDVMVISERVGGSGESKSLPNAKKVKISDIEGEVAEVFGARMLKFSLNNVEISISGKLSEEELIKVAESMV